MAKELTMPNYLELTEVEFKQVLEAYLIALAQTVLILEGARE